MSDKIHVIFTENDGRYVSYYCFGCGYRHSIPVMVHGEDIGSYATTNRWQWNGLKVAPSLSPSVKHTGGQPPVCHYFVRNGYIEYCVDSAHTHAGAPFAMADYNEQSKRFDYED